jgi:hypothetical protein
MLTLRLRLLVALALGLAAGCGQGPLARVSGKVTYRGEAVPAGNITFHSEDQGPYSAALHEDGSYEIIDVPPGEMVVTVETETYNPNKARPAYGGSKGNAIDAQRLEAEKQMGRPINAGGPPKYVRIPPKYARFETSQLTATLKPGRQTYDIELKD